MKKPVIIISGATATGKTQISIDLSNHLKENGIASEVVNFDSLLFYKELSIGTAKPTTEEIGDVPHSLIDICSISSPLNAADYNKLCLEKIKQLHQSNIVPILTGGSAFYIRAVIKGMYSSPTISNEIRESVNQIYQSQGIEKIRELLNNVDPQSVQQLHVNDHYRNIRAYEHFLSTNSPLSKEKEKLDEKDPYDFDQCIHKDWKLFHIYLSVEKDQHWQIMNKRAANMVANGLIQEVRNLLELGFSGNEKPLGSIGYKETISYINGEIKTQDELIEKIYIATRRLAKSQKTFFNKVHPKNTFNPLTDKKDILNSTKLFLDSFD